MRQRLLAAIAIACAAACGGAGAQALVVDTRAPRPAPAPTSNAGWSDEQRPIDPKDVAMPWVRGGPPGVAARINDAMYLQVIESLAPRAAGTTFTPPPPPHPSLGFAFCGLGFSVERNDGRVLSLAMALDWRGQHCYSETQWFHFDVATGRQLDAADLITPAGQAALKAQARQAAVANYERLLARLPPDPDDQDVDAAPSPAAPAPPSQPYEPSDDEQRTFFKTCLAGLQAPPSDAALEFSLPAAGGLELPGQSCATSRYEWRMDEPPGPLVVPDARLAPLLTPYGRRLLLGDGHAAAPATLFGQTLRGHVGKVAVTLHLGALRGTQPDEVDAVYAYDRIGTAIPLSAHVHGDTLEMTEDVATQSGFTLRQAGSTLVGTWHGKGRVLPVRLQ